MPVEEVRGPAAKHVRERFSIDIDDVEPRTFVRLTDNWIELTVRFLAMAHGVREVKDRMSRELLREMNAAGIDVASATYDIIGLPPVRVEIDTREDAQRRTAAPRL